MQRIHFYRLAVVLVTSALCPGANELLAASGSLYVLKRTVGPTILSWCDSCGCLELSR